ncbi:MAG: WD40 repeat domain-containing protein [Myxococcota bacterium]
MHLGEGTGDTRRTAPLAEFTGADRTVLDGLVEHRLVTLDGETASIAHEALLREWQTLQGWLAEDRSGLRLRQEVTAGAQLWASHARDEGLLWRGARLQRAVEVLADDATDLVLTPDEQAFLQAGVARDEAEAEAARTRAQERLRAARRLIAALVAVVLVVGVGLAITGLLLVQLQQALVASENRGRAQAALRALAERQPVAARWLHAGVQDVETPGWRQTALDLLDLPAPTTVLHGHTGPVIAAAFSPDGQRVVTASLDDTARVWQADGTGLPVVLEGHTNGVTAAAFSPDDQHVVTASDDRTARVWRADGTGSPVVLEGHTGGGGSVFRRPGARVGQGDGLWAAAFSPDGQHVVTASVDGTARVWRADGTGDPVVLEGHAGPVWAAAFSPDGAHVVTASWNGTARVWRADGTGSPVVLEGHADDVRAASFSPDGQRVVTASDDRTARVWQADGTEDPVVLEGHTDSVTAAAFSPDGQHVVTASCDRTARVWRADGTGAPVVLQGHTDRVTAAAFSPDSQRVVTASDDRTARVWQADGTGAPVVLKGHTGFVNAAAFSPDGQRVVTASRDRTARVWQADGTGSSVVLQGHNGVVMAAVFSPDGQRVVTASWDRTARVWPWSPDSLRQALLRETEPCLAEAQRVRFLDEPVDVARARYLGCLRATDRLDNPSAIVDHVVDPWDDPHQLQPPRAHSRGWTRWLAGLTLGRPRSL